MVDFPQAVWAVMAGIGAVAAIGSLGALAARRQRELAAHELRTEADRLRREYMERLRPIEVGFADEEPDGGTF